MVPDCGGGLRTKPVFSAALLYRAAVLFGAALLCSAAVLGFAGTAGAEDFLPGYLYQNPLLTNVADPYVFRASDGNYYLYATGGFRAWRSADLLKYTYLGSVKTNHAWGFSSFWAPEVVEHEGKFYLYYTADGPGGQKYIGVAVSDSAAGPFREVLDRPLLEAFPAIDANVFIDDDGRKYLYVSRQAAGHVVEGKRQSWIYGVELGDDMISLKGEPVLLAKPEQPWEASPAAGMWWNEGSTVIKHNGVYYLIWSANCYCNRNYSVGYATSNSPLGPFVKYEGNPILSVEAWDDRISGPGHGSVVASPDGTELFYAYHTHVDPAAGGGLRQLNLDRMGFRPDGTLFISGPTLSPQPVPSGSSHVMNVAKEAAVAASSTAPGRTPAALTDGELGIYARFERYEWASDGEGEGAWVELRWEEPRELGFILVYGSAVPERRLRSVAVHFSDGSAVEDVRLPVEPGAAAIVPAPRSELTWVRVIAGPPAVEGGTAGLSEIMALTRPYDDVRFLNPRPNAILGASEPVEIDAPGIDVAEVTVRMNSDVIYRGSALPGDLRLRAASFAPGEYELGVEAVDAAGRRYRYATKVAVMHLEMVSPSTWGEIVKGDMKVEIKTYVAPEDIAGAGVELVGVGPGTASAVLHSGPEIPERLTVDTSKLPDGAYDLVAALELASGSTTTVSRRVVIRNWEVFEDALLAPVSSGWFGSVDRLRTVDRAGDWRFTSADRGDFFDDPDRMALGGGDGYLTWNFAGVEQVAVTAYSRSTSIGESVRVEVSPDGRAWAAVPVAVGVARTNEQGIHELRITAEIPESHQAAYVRVTLSGRDAEGLELGHVVLRRRLE